MFEKNELVQFVFADPEESFFLPGGIRTDLVRKLTYELQSIGICRVLRVNRRGEWSRMDGATATSPDPCCEARLFGTGTVQRWIVKQLESREKTAILLDLAEFDRLFRKDRKQLERLITQVSRQPENRLVLLSSLDASDSHQVFTREDSPFVHCFRGEYLSEKLHEVLLDNRADLYRSIREQASIAYVLNSTFIDAKSAKEDLRGLLTRLLLEHGKLDWSDKRSEDCLRLLYCVMHSSRLQRKLGIDWSSYTTAYRCLCNPEIWQRLTEELTVRTERNGRLLISDLRQETMDFLELSGGIHQNSLAGQGMLAFRLPDWTVGCTDEEWKAMNNALCFIRIQILTPWRDGIAPDLSKYIESFRERLRDAADGGFESLDYFRTVLEALRRCCELAGQPWIETAKSDISHCDDMVRIAAELARDEKTLRTVEKQLETEGDETTRTMLSAKLLSLTSAVDVKRKELSVLRIGLTTAESVKKSKLTPEQTREILRKKAEIR